MADQPTATTPLPAQPEPAPQFTPEDIERLAEFFGLLIDIDRQQKKSKKEQAGYGNKWGSDYAS